MAQPRYTRIDNRRPSSSGYCSTVTIVVFVALCLVGLWMMTSSSLGPDQSVNLDNKDGIKNQMTPPAEEGNDGQKPEDGTGKTPNDESSSKEEEKEEKTKEESSSSGETEGGENKKDDGSDSDEKKDSNEENPDSNEKQTKPETEDNESGEDGDNQTKFEADESEKKSSDDDKETKTGNEGDETKPDKENTKTSVEQESQPKNETSGGAQLELVNETVAQNGSFPTQATESKKEKEAQKSSGDQIDFEWKVCNTTAGPDYIPCLDNVQAIKSLKDTKHYEHRERHCPDSPPTCLVPLPEGYKRPIEWPKSREKVCLLCSLLSFI